MQAAHPTDTSSPHPPPLTHTSARAHTPPRPPLPRVNLLPFPPCSDILLDERWRVKIADFGLSRARHRTFLSASGQVRPGSGQGGLG